ncbi:Cdc6-like AAA superfamily ATPase [Rhizobium sp. BK316]|uniref:P-loop NTPase fold protein n=1 Tax=Rhizobium sp. BK316 TaxID=2587053 RepID=UPI001617D411|nr:P-loop NTPase fold protein [Rhizobium sp. BK316]MBB3412168.1 Cdc6-like AAA superfamily ATPase [Rhizobium sp. BK316]
MKIPFLRNEPVGATATELEEPVSVISLAIEPQSHLEKYLAYYVGRLKPGYAVLVTGEWGTGKTHQVRRALPDTHAHYISLFGLNTPSEIEAQIFTKMFPKASAVRRFAEKMDSTSVGIPVLGSLGTGGLASLLTGPFIKNEVDNSRPLILDDLERCTVENAVLLGMINRYVEHHGCRVIVIAHDTKVVETFADTKEKVFGQTLHVEPNVEAALAEFVAFFKDPQKPDKLGAHRREVLSTFRESGTSSLRILRHVIEDVGRLADALEDRHFENDMAMVELVRLFSALAVEARTNKLEREDLFRRKEKIFSHKMDMGRAKTEEPPKSRLYDAAQRYTSIDIGSTLLGDDVLAEMLFDGRFTEEHIRTSLNNSAYFLEKEAAPPWQIVGSFDKLDDEYCDPALARMNEQFEKRQVTDSGEFLHIVALKMMMASRGVLKVTSKQIADDAKLYIDDLVAAKRLPPRKAGWMWTEEFKDASGGVMYWVVDSYRTDFEGVFDYLVKARTSALTDTLPGKVPALLEAVKTDGQKFFDMVCHSRNATLEYEDIPIFAYVDPAAFVDAWLESPKTGWYWIGNALKERHKVLTQYPALASESAWYPQVHKEMVQRAHSQEGLARIRMERAAELMGIPKHAPATRASAKATLKPTVAAAIPTPAEGEAGAVPEKPKRAPKEAGVVRDWNG